MMDEGLLELLRGLSPEQRATLRRVSVSYSDKQREIVQRRLSTMKTQPLNCVSNPRKRHSMMIAANTIELIPTRKHKSLTNIKENQFLPHLPVIEEKVERNNAKYPRQSTIDVKGPFSVNVTEY